MLVGNCRKAALAGTESQTVPGANPQPAIAVQAQCSDKDAGQAFLQAKLPKTRAIILIEAALRADPQKARAVLKQAVDAEISQAVDIVLEGVLVAPAYRGNPGEETG